MSDAVQRLIDSGALDEAARALERTPETRLMLRLAAALQDRELADEALAWYRRILEIEPHNGEALLCLAVLHEDTDLEQARRVMDTYVAARPADWGARMRRALMLPVIMESNGQIDAVRARLDADLDEIAAARPPPLAHPEFEIGATPFFLAYHGRDATALLRKIGRTCRALYPARTTCERRLSSGKLRIGFVSSYFHTHSIARTTYGLVRDLPREQFEVGVFAIAPRADPWNELMRGAADFYAALPLDLERVREAIDAAKLDMLFFADIGMDPLTYFLAFWRLAPVQLTTWGHPLTTGIDTLDYFISADAIEPPEAQAYYSERLIRLPGYFLPRYRRPRVDGRRKSRGELGLPASRHLYCCPQNLFKLHPDFDLALKAILERDPEGDIVLLEGRRGWTRQLLRRFERTLGALGSRIRFVPRVPHDEFMQYLAAADVVLDPFYFGGCNSSSEALSLAKPLVTLPAAQLPGRFTLGMYREMGLDSCIAGSAEAFVEIAVRLGRDADYRKSVAAEIAARNERLFERPDAGRALGAALREIAEEARSR